MKASLVILSFFAAGILLGLFRWIPVDFFDNQLSFYVLCTLMLAVGFSIGNDPNTIRKFSSLNIRYVFLPITTIVGTLLGVAAVSLLLHHRSLTDCLAIGSGMGYYSLSGILITQYKGVELGTIALLANIFREVFALLLAPVFAKHFGLLSPIAAGGATTMDTTLPIIVRYSGSKFTILSIYHGFITDLSVPFLVTFFCSI